MKNYEWLIFDIGGVLVELDCTIKIWEMLYSKADIETINQKWNDSVTVKAFETGKISPEKFADNIIDEFELDISPQEFLLSFSAFPKKLYEGAEEFLKQINMRYKTAVLSNISEIHWNRFLTFGNISKYIDKKFLSYQIGFMKPDNEAYKIVIKELNCPPEKIIFFDDNEKNVEAALKAGMDSVKVNGIEELKLKIKELGLM